MRIDITFTNLNDGTIRLPRINLHLLQAMVYKIMPDELSEFLHDTGYKYEKRKFKLFTYSWLMGKSRAKFDEKYIYFVPPLKLVVTSPIPETLEGIANGSLTGHEIRLGNNELSCSSVIVTKNMAEGNSMVIKTLSPITCYSTLYRPDGSPYTVYYDPREAIFEDHVHENLKKKYQLIHPEHKLPQETVNFEPLDTPRQQVAMFSPDDSRPVKGWWGKFRLKGPRELLQIGLDAGLGAKNSAGFGCVSINKTERRR